MKRLLTVLPTELVLSSTASNSVMSLCETFNSVVPCIKILLNRTSTPEQTPAVFLYKIEASDGRIWRQHITFDNPSNPKMTFEVVDPWRLSEFSNQRNVRNAFVNLVAAYPALEKIVYDFYVV